MLGWAAGAAVAVIASWQMIYRIRFGPPETYSSHLTITFATTANHAHSWCLSLAVAALACAVLGVVAQSVANRAERHLAG